MAMGNLDPLHFLFADRVKFNGNVVHPISQVLANPRSIFEMGIYFSQYIDALDWQCLAMSVF